MKKKLSILSLSTVTGVATVLTTIIPLIATAFPDQSLVNVETLITISSLSALITILLNELIVKKIGLKKTVIIGLLIGMLAGIVPYFITSYRLFFISRIALGIGIGLYSPHAISLISLFYKGEERVTLLGMQMGISALGNAILLFLSGWLAAFNWKWVFFVYLFLGLVALGIWYFVPEIKINQETNSKRKMRLDKSVKKYLFLCFITFLIIWGVQLKIPTFLVEQGITSSGKTGFLLSMMNIAGMLAGLSFGFCFRRAKVYLLPIGFVGAGLSVLGMISSSSWLFIFIFAVLFNFIYSFTGPTITLKVNQLAAESQLTKVNSLITTTTILSSYAAPFVWNGIVELMGSKENVSLALTTMVVALLSIGVFLLLYYWFHSKKLKEN